MLGRGEVKLGILPVAALLVLFLAAVPVAGYVAILWSVGTFVDMLAPPAVTISSLRFVPAEILLWIALGSLVFLPRDVRRGLRALARRRESVVMATVSRRGGRRRGGGRRERCEPARRGCSICG